MSFDHALVLFAVLIAFIAWKHKRDYFLISMILVADFALFFGFDEIWLHTDYIVLNQDLVFILKGFTYFAFFYLYLIGGSSYLAGLSVLAGFYHFTLPIFGVSGYSEIMTVYCIMQLFGALTGVLHDYVHRHIPHFFSFTDHLHRHKRKNQGRR